MEGYDVAQVCPNGHIANDMSIAYPDHNQDYCKDCGEKTITACPKCNSPIRGGLHGVFTAAEFIAPAFCIKCGTSFPWTERKIRASIELALEIEGLQGEDAEQFSNSIREIVRDTPQTQVAASRVKKFFGKFSASTVAAIRDITIDIISETAKKTIWGN